MTVAYLPQEHPHRRSTARRALVNATSAMLLVARGTGAADAALKRLLMEMRADDVSVLTHEETQFLIDKLDLREA